MRHLVLLLLLTLSGCMPDKESPAYSVAVQQSKKMIDEGVLKSKYIIIDEMESGKYGSIYRIDPSTSILGGYSLGSPEKITKYKDKFICFTSPTAQSEIAYKDLLRMTDFEHDTDSTYYDIHRDAWFLGVSKDGKKHTLVNYLDADSRTYYLISHAFPKLWEYISKDYNEANPPRFIFEMYELIVDDNDKSKGSLKKHLEAVEATIYYYNSDDKCFAEAERKESPSFFAVINENDTLRFNIEEAPLYQHIHMCSTPNPSFFKTLPEDDTFNSLHKLMHDSIFFFQFEGGKYVKHSVLSVNAQWSISVKDTKNKSGYCLYKEGVNPVLKDDGSYYRWLNSK